MTTMTNRNAPDNLLTKLCNAIATSPRSDPQQQTNTTLNVAIGCGRTSGEKAGAVQQQQPQHYSRVIVTQDAAAAADMPAAANRNEVDAKKVPPGLHFHFQKGALSWILFSPFSKRTGRLNDAPLFLFFFSHFFFFSTCFHDFISVK
jgi:hypothetical protein